MNFNSDKKEIIFILPYLNVNTTSAERFKSLISAFDANDNFKVRILIIDYKLKRSYFTGLQTNSLDNFSLESTESIFPKLNIVQKAGFYFLNKNYKLLWRLFQLLHLLIYQTDVFSPGKIFVKKECNFGYVFSSGSHFSFFETADAISRTLNFKLLIDFRDPWTFGYTSIDGFKFVKWFKVLFGRKKEIRSLNNSYLITTVSKSLKQFFPGKFQSKISVIPNGSNYLDKDVIKETPNEVFNILYAGTIYNDQLIDKSFFNALNKFLKNKDVSKISLKFIGSSQNENLYKIIKDFHLENITEITPRLKKDELLNYLNNASLFFHLKLGNRKNVISSKQAEYLMFRRPILLPISDYGDMAESIINHNAGYVCESESQIFETLELLWNKFKSGENLFIHQSEEFVESISRKKIAEDFVKFILED